MQLPAAEVTELVRAQLEHLSEIAAKQNTRLHHVKPHGALYNMASKDAALATAICRAVLATDPALVLYAQSGSVLISVAESMGIKTCNEVFADRSYQPDGSLTPRSAAQALLETEAAVVAQVLQMVQQQTVMAEGKPIPVKAETVCIHGDGAHALDFARSISNALKSIG